MYLSVFIIAIDTVGLIMEYTFLLGYLLMSVY